MSKRTSIIPRIGMLPSSPTEEEIQMAKRLRLMSEEERREEDKKLDRIKKAKLKEIIQRIKSEDRFFYNINAIQEKIKEKRADLYLGKTFVSFKSLDLCVIFLRMFQSDLQKEILADANDKRYDYLTKVTARMAPFIDDLRWEHMYKSRHFYVVEVLFVIFVSSVNMAIEKEYNHKNLREMVINKRGLSDPTWILPLLFLLLLQVLLSVVSVVCLEKMISRYTFYKRSKKIEINFIFFNCFLLLNNIMVVFYGFMIAAYELGETITEDKRYYYNFYINFQWIKNSLIIIFIPLLQRIVGDYLIKWHLIPIVSKMCKKKEKVEDAGDNQTNASRAVDADSNAPSSPLREKSQNMASENVEDDPLPEPEDYNSQEDDEEENQHDDMDIEGIEQKKKPIHDFGLNSSYLIQVAFFTGFYLSFRSPLLLTITFIGVWLNYKFEDRLLKTVYDKTRYVSISNLFVTLRWAFIAFCLGTIISVSNSKIYLFIINKKSTEFSQISKVTGFQNMIGFCNFAIGWIYFVQMRTNRIMFRVLNSIDSLTRKFGGSFFKPEFEKENYRSQNPYYSF